MNNVKAMKKQQYKHYSGTDVYTECLLFRTASVV